MGTAETSNMLTTKVLFAACALFVVAHATDIYAANWEGTDCSGTAAESSKFTLDQCTNGGTSKPYSKFSLSGSTYTIKVYASTDTTCTGNSVTVSGAADACLTLNAGSIYAKVLSGSTHLSGAAATEDCTSGTCVAATTQPTSDATQAPTTFAPTSGSGSGNSACHVSIGIMSVFLGLVAHWIA